MAQLEDTDKSLEITNEDSTTSPSCDRSQVEVGNTSTDPAISRSGSFSRLNASAPEFVPRAPSPAPAGGHTRVVKIHHHPPPPQPVIHVFHPPPPSPPTVSPQFIPPGPPIGVFEYYGGALGGGGGFGDHEPVQPPADSDSASPVRDGLSEDVVQKITKQVLDHLFELKICRSSRDLNIAMYKVEYYFSDANLATTEHLMRFISKDPDGFVPISVVASFKKIKALVHNNFLLANALRTSSKLVVNDDGKKVRRLQPFTEADVEELQSRIVVAENLPEDHSYQNLMKIFSCAGSVKTIRTCYPQTPNGTTAPTNRSSKLDMLFCNKLHAFVEYETVDDAERAVAEVNKERNWRSGLRLRLLNKCMAKHVSVRGRKAGNDADGTGEEDEAYLTTQADDPFQQTETAFESLGGEELANEREGGGRRSKAPRGRGRGRGRGQHHNINNHQRGGGSGHGHPIGTPTAAHQIHNDQSASHKQPPGPRMPDGTRGFTMGRGKPSLVASSSSTIAAG